MKFVKDKIDTLSEWGESPSVRGLEDSLSRSLIMVDKPAGPTSHQVSSWIQKMFEMKAGHSGTLDPNVTGVLPMGLGHSVRVLDYLHEVSKEYVVAMKFHGDVGVENVKEILKEYTGEIYQTPPVRSGVKRERRSREIYEIELLDNRKREFLFRVRCESGTYIRTLCKDIGKTAGTGGHMMELRRTESGGFFEEESHILQDIRDAWEKYKDGDGEDLEKMLLPYERALEVYSGIKIKDTAAGSILNGADLAVPGISEMDDFEAGDRVSIYSIKGEGLAVGEVLESAERIMEMDEGLVVKTDRVFSPSGKYPKPWK